MTWLDRTTDADEDPEDGPVERVFDAGEDSRWRQFEQATTAARPSTRHAYLEFLGRYSRWAYWITRAQGILNTTDDHQRVTNRERPAVRKLSSDEAADLVQRYRAGATATELSRTFDVHRATVASHVRRAGHWMRGQSMTVAEVDRAAARYANG